MTNDLLPCLIRHKKRGTLYEPIGAATIQSKTDLIDGDLVYLYRDINNGSLWARKHDEFFDGRFESVPDTRANKPAEVDLEGLKLDADNAYCRYIDQIDKKCRGADYKLEHGEFSKSDLSAHIQAYETLGFHRGIHHALNIIKGHLATGKGGGEPYRLSIQEQGVMRNALRKSVTVIEPQKPAAPAQIDAGELEAAINKSGGPRLGDPGYIFTNMKTVKILLDAARAHLEKSKGGV